MIPEFPNFKKLELSDKTEVEKFTRRYPPYSDFNFVSMWSWDIYNSMRVSQLNKNLVVLFNDYLSREKFLSFIGENLVPETTTELISFSKKNYKVNFMKLIPEEVASLMPLTLFKTEQDRDSYDYVYSVTHLANMNNWSKNTSGKRVRKFLKLDLNYTIRDLSVEEIDKNEYRNLFKKWADSKNIDNHFELNEYKAFERFLQISGKNLRFVSLYIANVLVGFTAYEIVSNDFAISHFAKVDHAHPNTISDALNWEEAKLLNKKGIKYFNWEQDLGIPGLRYSKEKYKHSFFLKKFIVSEK